MPGSKLLVLKRKQIKIVKRLDSWQFIHSVTFNQYLNNNLNYLTDDLKIEKVEQL